MLDYLKNAILLYNLLMMSMSALQKPDISVLFFFCILKLCVLCLSTVLASSWGADEAVNASHWSRQK